MLIHPCKKLCRQPHDKNACRQTYRISCGVCTPRKFRLNAMSTAINPGTARRNRGSSRRIAPLPKRAAAFMLCPLGNE
ncbi:MAG: hypothetical protein PUB12_10595 [[Clostridium] aminophilum]|nr:hypothetical protein [[Clostridium] aminophilum]